MDSFTPSEPNSQNLDQTPEPTPPVPSHSPKPRWVWMLVLLGCLGGSLGIWRFFAPSGEAPTATAQQQKGPPPRPVELVALRPGQGVQPVELLGQVEATERATVRSQTSGVVKQVLVQAGDRVSNGMMLAVLDDADQRLALAEAQARLAQQRSQLARLEVGTRPEVISQRQAALRSAQSRYKEAQDNLRRTENLVQEGALSQRLLVEAQSRVQDAEGAKLAASATLAEAKAGPIREEIQAQRAEVAAAQAAVNQARLSLQRTQIQSPTAGVVQTRRVSPGDYLESGDEVITLVGGGGLDVFLELPENLSGQIRPGAPVRLTSRALPRWQGQATISGLVPTTEASSRRQRVRLRLNNPPPQLLPGMAVQGNLQLPVNRASFVVSRDALTRRRDQWLVFAVNAGKAEEIPVEVVADMGEQMAIASPQLVAGQDIVIRGGDGLRPGAPVKVVTPK